MSSNSTDTEVFVYTGEEGAEVPRDVVRVRVDPSVTSIPVVAFEKRKKLTEVELSEGLVEIGDRSFGGCDHSITKINIPNSLRRINILAFSYSLRTPIHLHDGIESIGEAAFADCIFTNFRVPPLVTVIPEDMLYGCRSTFSLELPETMTEIGSSAFFFCHSLRNVAIPPNAALADDIFINREQQEMINQHLEGNSEEIQRLIKKCSWTDLQQLFGCSEERILRELRHRFDELPVHSIVYYHTYYQGRGASESPGCNKYEIRPESDITQ
jgi:hypothetical protein